VNEEAFVFRLSGFKVARLKVLLAAVALYSTLDELFFRLHKS
jgi:hypothetical protein